MNLGLVTSFIIAGLLMITIVTLNVRVGQNSADITLHAMSQSRISAISDIIQYDFAKVGYNVDGPISNPILIADETEIQFLSNLENDASGTVRTVTWRLSDIQLPGSNNPRHRNLKRIVDSDETDITLGVSRFQIFYYKPGQHGPLTSISATDKEEINRIEVILEVEPREGTGRNNQYTTSSWRKVFTPPNLNL
jgi:hypothetical protein